MGVKTLLSGKIQNGRHEITNLSYHIFTKKLDGYKIISPNHMFSVSRNAINKRYIHLTSISCKILSGRHKITKVIISSLIIQIETGLFHLTLCFWYQGMQ